MAATIKQPRAYTEYVPRIEGAIEEFFEGVPSRFKIPLSSRGEQALRLLQEYTLRPGKRIRGCLAALSYDSATGGHYGAAGIQLGVVHELLQSYLLIIDDVMDGSMTRRGKSALHITCRSLDSTMQDHEAGMLAIDIALLAQHLANMALLTCNELPHNVATALRTIHSNLFITGLGQFDDIWQTTDRPVPAREIEGMYMQKTGYYTFANPLQSGYLLAGVQDEELFTAMGKFGEAAGVLFQIMNDYDDLFAGVADDFRDKKYTLLVRHMLTHASKTDGMQLQALLRKQAISQEDIAFLRSLCDRTGTKQYVLERTLYWSKNAKQALETLPVGVNLQQSLRYIVDLQDAKRRNLE